jgi:L-asparaginase II
MSDPVLVEVLRGMLVESRHRGAVAVIDADGNAVFALGDVTVPVFPRSAVKALQALVLIETGAADKFGLGDEELALACSSHSGEPGHVAASSACWRKPASTSRRWPAARIGRRRRRPLPRWLAPVRRRRCTTIAPASMRAFCVMPALWVSITGYWKPEHPVQRQVRARLLEDDRRDAE